MPRPGLSGRIPIPPSACTSKRASTGACSTVLRSFVNHASAPGPAIASSVLPSTGRERSSAMRHRGSFQRTPEYSSRTGAESASRAWRAAGARSAASTSTGSIRTGSATVSPRSSRASARTILPCGRLLVELQSGLAGHELDREPAPDELRLDVALIDRACQTRELVVQGSCIGLGRRHDLGAEEARLQAAEAADRPEALALAGGRLDCRRPVGLDAERRRLDRIALASGGEHDGHVGDLVEAPLAAAPAPASASTRPRRRRRSRHRRRAELSNRRMRARRARSGPRGVRARPGSNARSALLNAVQAPNRRELVSIRPARSPSV